MQVRLLGLAVIVAMMACGGDATSNSGSDLFQIRVTNDGADSLKAFGVDVDVFNVTSDIHLELSDGSEVPFQLEDRNRNNVPDKLFALVDIPVGGYKTIIVKDGAAQENIESKVQLIANVDGQPIESHTYTGTETWRHDGIILENEWISYRAFMHAPFAMDIIGKRSKPLLLHDLPELNTDIQEWGGDVLDEGNLLGFGSPGFYDYRDIIPFSSFDERTVEVLSAGPLRAEVQTTIHGIPVRGEKISIRMRWLMQADKHWAEVHLELLTQTDLNLQIAFGMPRHADATDFTQGKVGNTHFAYTYGLQSAQGEQLGMGLLVPGEFEIDHYRDDPENFYYLATPIDQKVQYRMLASWVQGQLTIFDEVDFLGLVRAYASEYDQRPEIQVTAIGE